MAIRYILFDAVGTLIYPEPSVTSAYEAVAKGHGLSVSSTAIQSRFAAAYDRVFRREPDLATNEVRERQRWRAVVAEVFCESPEMIDSLLEQLWQHFARGEHWPMFDDVAETWRELAARGYVLGMASNFDARLRSILAGHACLASCPYVFVSTELGHAKPSGRFFSAVQQRLKARPDEILMVGDDEINDVMAPREAGWQALALNRKDSTLRGLNSLRELASCLP
jgi:putative hydrolase of the HAD superfamily